MQPLHLGITEESHVRSGDRAFGDASHALWFNTEVLPHEPALRAWLRSRFPSLSEREDVLQESYFRLIRAHVESRISNVRAYLYVIARNVALDTIRRSKRTPIVPVAEPEQLSVIEDRPDAAELASGSQELELLNQAIESLPGRCREIMTLQKVHGLSNQAIADRLGLSINTVNAQLVVGLARCRRFLLARGVLRGGKP